MRHILLLTLAFYLSLIAGVYVFGPEDPSYCDFYPMTCQIEGLQDNGKPLR